jgi:hypothetical protein
MVIESLGGGRGYEREGGEGVNCTEKVFNLSGRCWGHGEIRLNRISQSGLIRDN